MELRICHLRTYEQFILINSEDQYLHVDETTPIDQFMSELPTHIVNGDQTLLDVAKEIWIDDKYVEVLRNESLIFQKKANSYVKRKFYCYQLGKSPLDISLEIEKLTTSDQFFLVFSEDLHNPTPPDSNVLACLSIPERKPKIKSYLDHLVTQLEDAYSWSDIKGLLLYTEEDKELAIYLRENYQNLDAMTRSIIDIMVLEEPHIVGSSSFSEYWMSFLNSTLHRVYNFIGYTNHKPYSKSVIYDIVSKYNIELTDLPCLVVYNEIDEELITLKIGGDIVDFFRRVVHFIEETQKEIEKELDILRKSIEAKIKVIKLPPYQTKPGSQARMKEALEMVEEIKRQRKEGKVEERKVYEEVDRVIQPHEAKKKSFEYFKSKFMDKYLASIKKTTPNFEFRDKTVFINNPQASIFLSDFQNEK